MNKKISINIIIAVIIAFGIFLITSEYFYSQDKVLNQWSYKIEWYEGKFKNSYDTRLVRLDKNGNKEIIIESTNELYKNKYLNINDSDRYGLAGITGGLRENGREQSENPAVSGSLVFLQSVPLFDTGGGSGTFYSYDISSGKLAQLNNQPEDIGSLSPDGLKHAFASYNSPEVLVVIFLESDTRRIVAQVDGVNETLVCYRSEIAAGIYSWVDNETIKYGVCDPNLSWDSVEYEERPVIREYSVNIYNSRN